MRRESFAAWHSGIPCRGISHPPRLVPERRSAPRSGSSVRCHVSQITSISALLAIDFSVMCGARS